MTICTPAFNRGYTLKRLYESLKKQTIRDFEWIIIDDGSEDNTKSMVKEWIEENKINVSYYFQENSGKHIALNKGINLAKGEVFTCLDSDDWFTHNTVEIIKKQWEEIREVSDIAGIITLDSYENGEIIGSKFPENLDKVNWIDLQFEYKVTGDKAYFFKKEIISKYNFPSYSNNKHMPPSYQYFLVSQDHQFRLLNEVTKFVEYMDDGISRNKYKKYILAPDNFAYYRLVIMDLIPTFKRKVINAIHFNASIYLGVSKFKPISLSNKLLVFFTKPLGLILSKYIRSKNKLYT